MSQHQTPPPAPSSAPANGVRDYDCHDTEQAMEKLLNASAQFRDLHPGLDRKVSTREETIAMMHHYLNRLELVPQVQNELKVIHVAGTKGKGSTCAMVERILRHHGLKTGLFTSPHLISPCERFRINGQPISDALFLHHFNAIWSQLEATTDVAQREGFPPMAWFFRFLTLLALRLFLTEQVDVVILEVGLGGRLDATNVIQKPVVCGITTLDLDHTRVLGNTIDRIAYAKAGIFKPHVPVFTMNQEELAMEMLEKCAQETETPLFVVPCSLDDFVNDKVDGKQVKLKMQGEFQRRNASLAIALASTWLRETGTTVTEAHNGQNEMGSMDHFNAMLTPTIANGLSKAFWPGRSHVVQDKALIGSKKQATYYLDGAHTFKSLECCVEWYRQSLNKNPNGITTPSSSSGPQVRKALIFTIHHERDVVNLLQPLLQVDQFDRVYFCSTRAIRPSIVDMPSVVNALVIANREDLIPKAKAQAQDSNATSTEDVSSASCSSTPGKQCWPATLARLWELLATTRQSVHVCEYISDCIEDLRAKDTASHDDVNTNGSSWHVLVTGSLYLVGEALDLLQDGRIQ